MAMPRGYDIGVQEMLFGGLLVGACYVLWCIFMMQVWPLMKVKLAWLPKANKLPPGSMGWPYFGETLSYLNGWTIDKSNPDTWFDERRRRYGDVFRTFLLGAPTVVMLGAQANQFVLSNENTLFENAWPESLHELEGRNAVSMVQAARHARLRKLLHVSLGHSKLLAFTSQVEEAVLTCLGGLSDVAEVFPALRQLAFRINAKLFMGLEPGQKLDEMHAHYEVFTRGLESQPLDLPWTDFGRAKRARSVLIRHVIELIRRRREELLQRINCTSIKQNDNINVKSSSTELLDYMLLARDEESGELYSEAEISDNMLLLVHAGQDTTACALASTLLNLARSPAIAHQLRSDCSALATSKENPHVNCEDLKSVTLIRCALKEGLRLCPPITGLFKRAKCDLDFQGFTIPKGWTVHIVARHSHLKKEFFNDPMAFNPQRFVEHHYPRFAYFPFGQGVRHCPGMELANITMELFIYHFMCCFENFELLQPNEQMTIRTFSPYPEHGLQMRLKRSTTN